MALQYDLRHSFHKLEFEAFFCLVRLDQDWRIKNVSYKPLYTEQIKSI